MKVLHINASDIGSTGRIVQDINRLAVGKNWEAVALFPKRNRTPDADVKEYVTAMPMEQGLYRRLCKLYGHQYGFAPLVTRRILDIINREKPDVVHLHCINGHCVNIYRLLEHLKCYAIPTVVTNHAEFFYTGNCAHAFLCNNWRDGCKRCVVSRQATGCHLFPRTHAAWKKMKKAFGGQPNMHIVSVSPWSFHRSVQAPILEGLPQSTILNGVDTEIFSYRDAQKAKTALGLDSEEKIIFHVTANFSDNPNDMKGGRYLIELAKQMENQKVRFLVAALHSNVGLLPKNITLLDQVQDQRRMADYYAAADLTVLVSQRETFGMAVAESLCCGTPVVGFEAGGSESIALPEFTQFVPFGDMVKLKNAVCEKLDLKAQKSPKTISEEAVRVYSAARMAEQYLQLYRSMIAAEN